MLNIYNVMSANITDAIATNGDSVTKQPLIKNMRVIKKETLRLISDWISRSNDNAMVYLCFIYLFLKLYQMICIIFRLGFREFHSSPFGNCLG